MTKAKSKKLITDLEPTTGEIADTEVAEVAVAVEAAPFATKAPTLEDLAALEDAAAKARVPNRQSKSRLL